MPALPAIRGPPGPGTGPPLRRGGGTGSAEGGKCWLTRILRAAPANLTKAGSPTEEKSAGTGEPKWHSQIEDNLRMMGARRMTRSSGEVDATMASERQWMRSPAEGDAMLMVTGNRPREDSWNRNAAEMSDRQKDERGEAVTVRHTDAGKWTRDMQGERERPERCKMLGRAGGGREGDRRGKNKRPRRKGRARKRASQEKEAEAG